MYNWDEELIKWHSGILEENNTHEVSKVLFNVSSLWTRPAPTGNAQIIKHLQRLVKDRRWTIVDGRIPPAYGELRWLAARVLACEYAYQSIREPIILEDVPKPVEETELIRIKQQHGTLSTPVHELIEKGFWPTTTEIIKPQDYCEWCSKEAIEKRRREEEADK